MHIVPLLSPQQEAPAGTGVTAVAMIWIVSGSFEPKSWHLVCFYYTAFNYNPPSEKLSYSYTPNYLKEEKGKLVEVIQLKEKGCRWARFSLSTLSQWFARTQTVSDAMTFKPLKTNMNGAICSRVGRISGNNLLLCQVGCRLFLKVKQFNRWISVLKRSFQMTERCEVLMHPKAASGTC